MACMWVRVCGLPFEYLNMNVGRIIGQLLGPYFELEEFVGFPRYDFLRIRVCIILNEPLVPGFFLSQGGGNLLWIQFRYEDVFKYCVRCGRIGHLQRSCLHSPTGIEGAIQDTMQRVTNQGSTVVQTARHFTMYNLDLRALPSSTRYLTSRVRLGNHHGVVVPADSFEEEFVDFDLGTTRGGRIDPGTYFTNDNLPFSSPIIEQSGAVTHPTEIANEVNRGAHADYRPNPIQEGGIQDMEIQADLPESDAMDVDGGARLEAGIELERPSTDVVLGTSEVQQVPINPTGDMPNELLPMISHITQLPTIQTVPTISHLPIPEPTQPLRVDEDVVLSLINERRTPHGGSHQVGATEGRRWNFERGESSRGGGRNDMNDEVVGWSAAAASPLVTDLAYAIQMSVDFRLDGEANRARREDDAFGFSQTFDMDPLEVPFYAEPVGIYIPTSLNLNTAEGGNEQENYDVATDIVSKEGPHNTPESEYDWGLIDDDDSGPETNDISTQATSFTDNGDQGGLFDDSDISWNSEDIRVVFNTMELPDRVEIEERREQAEIEQAEVDNLIKQAEEFEEEQRRMQQQHEENQWRILSSSVLVDYRMDRSTVSENAIHNTHVNGEDDFGRISGMSRFRKKIKGNCTTDKICLKLRKRKARSMIEGSTMGKDYEAGEDNEVNSGVWKRLKKGKETVGDNEMGNVQWIDELHDNRLVRMEFEGYSSDDVESTTDGFAGIDQDQPPPGP